MTGSRQPGPLRSPRSPDLGALPGPIGLDETPGWTDEPFCKAEKWVPVGPVTGPMGAIIVPDTAGLEKLSAHDKGIFQENNSWARQWESHDKAHRKVFLIKVDASLSDFETVVGQASGGAGGKEVILFTGHGSLATGVKAETSFDTVPESSGMSTHKHRITQEILDLDTWAEKDSKGNWVPKPLPGGKHDPAKSLKEKEIKRLAPYYDMLQRIGSTMKNAGIDRFRLLTCRVGQDQAFVKKLAKVMGVKVVAYTGWTWTMTHTWSIPDCPNKGKVDFEAVQIWNGTKPPIPPDITKEGPTHESFSSVPTNNEVRGNP